MSFRDLFRRKPTPQRVRVCVECGMPIAEHRDWCSIFRTQQEMNRTMPAASQARGLKAEEG